jgi:hypothetical protein
MKLSNLIVRGMIILGCSLFVLGCGGSTAQLQLGPKPTPMGPPERIAWKAQESDKFRAWLESLSPADVKTLETSGTISFSYATLKTSDPTHAQLVADHIAGVVAAVKPEDQGKVAGLQNIQTVKFNKQAPGAYEVVIEGQDGQFTNLALSDPTG